MQALNQIIRLTRPLNLIIVLATMLVVRYSVMGEIMQKASIGMSFRLSGFCFSLLIVSAVFVAAAGNIINDYFDQKVDRINKPERVVVGRKVKRRVAIVLHQGLNISALLLTSVICIQTGYWWPLFIPVLIITLLWWYSPVFKKRLFIGNFTVAICTASVPLWAAIFEIHELRNTYGDLLVDPEGFFQYMWIWLATLFTFAFLITLIREAVKDMEDMEGDRAGEYQTIPLVYGTARTKNYVYVLFLLFLILASIGISRMHNKIDYLYFGLLVILPSLAAIFSLRNAVTQLDYHKCSRLLKLVIAGGLVLIVLIL